MVWLLPRLLLTLLAMAAGALLGDRLGLRLGHERLGWLVGAAIGVSAAFAVDALRVARLMRWLRSTSPEATAPRSPGFWGELGYRLERSLRARDRAFAAERQRLDDFLSAIEASPNGVMLLDDQDRIGWCNRAAALQFGLDARRDEGQAVTNLVRAPAFVQHLQHADWQQPVTVVVRGGEATLQLILRGYGKGQKLVLTQDVTERLRSEAMRRDFVANVSHEIRTPLTVLAGFVETMQSLPLSAAERGRVLTLMSEQTGRMQALVSDLLTLAQLEGSPLPPTDSLAPLGKLLQRALADGQTLSGGRHQWLPPEPALTDSWTERVAIAGRESELLSAVQNLVTNAVRYTPTGGQIGLVARLRDDAGLVIEVHDNGPGIAREHLARLTERFYRVDPSRARETGGTGLGLSIVKHVMQRHGGELDIESMPGKGSRFRLVLPAARVVRPDAVAAGDQSAPRAKTSVHS